MCLFALLYKMTSQRNLDKILSDYYENAYVEDDRLNRDKMHYMEFVTTTTYIDKYLKQWDRILEVGAWTWAYSLFYADKWYQVDAIELVQKNVDILKNNVKNNMNIKAIQGNALDLSMYEDNTFDITLVLWPLYHLFKKDEQEKAIQEAIRVTKPNWKIFIAFILVDLAILSSFQSKSIYNKIWDSKEFTIDFKPNHYEKYLFNKMYITEVKELMNKFDLENLWYVATDWVWRIMKDDINSMTDEEYKLFLSYHLSICEREDLIGYSCHILSIIEKNRKKSEEKSWFWSN